MEHPSAIDTHAPPTKPPDAPPVTPTAAAASAELTALRDKVYAFAEENQGLKNQIANLKRKLAASASASAPPAKKARTPSQKKRLFEKWSHALVRESRKHKVMYDMCAPDAYNITIKDTLSWTPAEFHELFDGYGQLIQPTLDNKPRAVVTILRFNTYPDVKCFFEDVGGAEIEETGYQVQLWRKKRFGRAYQYDTGDARMHEMEVHYNKTRQTLKLVFSLVYGGLLEAWGSASEEEETEAPPTASVSVPQRACVLVPPTPFKSQDESHLNGE